jgi:hypothetical protein
MAADQCQCVPWFLKEYFPDMWTCEAHGNACFDGIIAGRYDLAEGDECMAGCLPDCERVQFEILQKALEASTDE